MAMTYTDENNTKNWKAQTKKEKEKPGKVSAQRKQYKELKAYFHDAVSQAVE